jgi:hypothetical protein
VDSGQGKPPVLPYRDPEEDRRLLRRQRRRWFYAAQEHAWVAWFTFLFVIAAALFIWSLWMLISKGRLESLLFILVTPFWMFATGRRIFNTVFPKSTGYEVTDDDQTWPAASARRPPVVGLTQKAQRAVQGRPAKARPPVERLNADSLPPVFAPRTLTERENKQTAKRWRRLKIMRVGGAIQTSIGAVIFLILFAIIYEPRTVLRLIIIIFGRH